MYTRFPGLTAAALALLLLGLGAATGQVEKRNVEPLPPEENFLALEYFLSGKDARDKVRKESNAQTYAFQMTKDRTYVIELDCKSFDGCLRLEGPLGVELANAESGGKGRATLRYKATETGSHTIIVTTARAGTGGKFSLRAFDADDDEQGGPVTRPAGISVGRFRKTGTGFTATDKLTADDKVGSPRQGSNCKVYSLALQKNQAVKIDLQSQEFDAYLIVLDKNFRTLESNDDGGEGRNSRLQFRAPETGTYQVLATTCFPNTFGEYTLTILNRGIEVLVLPPPPVVELNPPFQPPMAGNNAVVKTEGKALVKEGNQRLAADELTRNNLEESLGAKSAKYHKLELAANEVVLIDLMSTDFDTYLMVTDRNGARLAFNDDGGEGSNSRLTFRAPAKGEYRLIATHFGRGPREGKYRISVREGVLAPPLQPPVLFPQKVPPPIAPPLPPGAGGLQGFLPRTKGKPFKKEATGLLATDSFTGDHYEGGRLAGKAAKYYPIELKEGDKIKIDMMSEELDSYLIVTDKDGRSLGQNDDNGESLDSRILFTAPAKGSYRIVATTCGPKSVGGYRLSVQAAAPGVVLQGLENILELAHLGKVFSKEGNLQLTEDRLTPKELEPQWQNRAAKTHTLELTAGQIVRIDLMSTEFDAHLTLTDSEGKILDEVDDGGDGVDSRMYFKAKEKGTYKLIASSLEPRTYGQYKLTIRPATEAELKQKGNDKEADKK